MPTLPLSIPFQPLPHSCPSSLAHSSSPLSFPSLFLAPCLPPPPPSFRRRLPSAPSYPRGNPRTASVPCRPPPPPPLPTATTRVYKRDQPGSTYLPFRIIRLACRPLLHAEFRLIKMRLRGPRRLRGTKTLDLNKSAGFRAS